MALGGAVVAVAVAVGGTGVADAVAVGGAGVSVGGRVPVGFTVGGLVITGVRVRVGGNQVVAVGPSMTPGKSVADGSTVIVGPAVGSISGRGPPGAADSAANPKQ